MSKAPSADEIKVCCATFYQGDLVRSLMGEIFHPGGLELTHHLGGLLGLAPNLQSLDVACGRGTSLVHLVESFGCHFTGLDYGEENISAAEAHAAEHQVTSLASFRQGDAEGLPFDDNSFDVVLSECSFCTFPDKTLAAREIARVLRPGGLLGLTDMTVTGPVPEDLQTALAWVACVSGAGTVEEYKHLLGGAGFTDFLVEDHRPALLKMVEEIRQRLVGVDIAVKIGKLDLGDMDVGEGLRVARRAAELVEKGQASYTLIRTQKT